MSFAGAIDFAMAMSDEIN